MQATMVGMAVLFIVITLVLWSWWSNPWKRIQRYIRYGKFRFMRCEHFRGNEIIYSNKLWIERREGDNEFIIRFTKPGLEGGLEEDAYGVPPESNLFKQIENAFIHAE